MFSKTKTRTLLPIIVLISLINFVFNDTCELAMDVATNQMHCSNYSSPIIIPAFPYTLNFKYKGEVILLLLHNPGGTLTTTTAANFPIQGAAQIMPTIELTLNFPSPRKIHLLFKFGIIQIIKIPSANDSLTYEFLKFPMVGNSATISKTEKLSIPIYAKDGFGKLLFYTSDKTVISANEEGGNSWEINYKTEKREKSGESEETKLILKSEKITLIAKTEEYLENNRNNNKISFIDELTIPYMTFPLNTYVKLYNMGDLEGDSLEVDFAKEKNNEIVFANKVLEINNLVVEGTSSSIFFYFNLNTDLRTHITASLKGEEEKIIIIENINLKLYENKIKNKIGRINKNFENFKELSAYSPQRFIFAPNAPIAPKKKKVPTATLR